MDDSEERLLEEVEALQAILMNEVSVKNNERGVPEVVESTVVPATADDTDQQYVRVTLEVTLPHGYPDTPPSVTLRNPRGLDDDTLIAIRKDAAEKIKSSKGMPVIYDLIELVREHLTSSNLPSCPCTICLYGFTEGDQFTKTACYHYYHAHCLACYIASSEKNFVEEQEKLPAFQREKKFEVLCPVCREPINCDIAALQQADPPLAVQMAQKFEPDESLRTLQQEMAKLYLHQKSRGGIIDPDAADSKVLLVSDTASPPASPPPRWQQRLQAQRAAQQQQQQRQQQPRPKPSKPAKPPRTDGGDDGDDGDDEGSAAEHSHGRQRRGRGRGGPRSHRFR